MCHNVLPHTQRVVGPIQVKSVPPGSIPSSKAMGLVVSPDESVSDGVLTNTPLVSQASSMMLKGINASLLSTLQVAFIGHPH